VKGLTLEYRAGQFEIILQLHNYTAIHSSSLQPQSLRPLSKCLNAFAHRKSNNARTLEGASGCRADQARGILSTPLPLRSLSTCSARRAGLLTPSISPLGLRPLPSLISASYPPPPSTPTRDPTPAPASLARHANSAAAKREVVSSRGSPGPCHSSPAPRSFSWPRLLRSLRQPDRLARYTDS